MRTAAAATALLLLLAASVAAETSSLDALVVPAKETTSEAVAAPTVARRSEDDDAPPPPHRRHPSEDWPKARLHNLTVEDAVLSPAFNGSIYEYSTTVDANVSFVDIHPKLWKPVDHDYDYDYEITIDDVEGETLKNNTVFLSKNGLTTHVYVSVTGEEHRTGVYHIAIYRENDMNSLLAWAATILGWILLVVVVAHLAYIVYLWISTSRFPGCWPYGRSGNEDLYAPLPSNNTRRNP
eukprot:SM000183S04002  [mRNA]  locus=s183:249849:251480:- [translate_table: standard]